MEKSSEEIFSTSESYNTFTPLWQIFYHVYLFSWKPALCQVFISTAATLPVIIRCPSLGRSMQSLLSNLSQSVTLQICWSPPPIIPWLMWQRQDSERYCYGPWAMAAFPYSLSPKPFLSSTKKHSPLFHLNVTSSALHCEQKTRNGALETDIND